MRKRGNVSWIQKCSAIIPGIYSGFFYFGVGIYAGDLEMYPVNFRICPINLKCPIDFKMCPIELEKCPIDFKFCPIELKNCPIAYRKHRQIKKEYPLFQIDTPNIHLMNQRCSHICYSVLQIGF